MKKRLVMLMAACLILAGCGSDASTMMPGGATPSSYESMEATQSDGSTGGGAPDAADDNNDTGGYELSDSGTDGGTASPSYDDPADEGGETGGYSTPGYSSDSSGDNDYDPEYSGSSTDNTPGNTSNNTNVFAPDTSESNDTIADSDNGDGDEDESESEADKKSESGSDEQNKNAADDGQDTLDQSENKTDISGYGKIFFVGDSRTVDMFDGNTTEIYDYNAGGIRVFARDACHCAYLTDVLGSHDIGEFDTLVSWLGCNDNNDAALYEQVYENLLNQGKKVVICTVGPTKDEFLSGDFDPVNYPNEKMVAFNQSITSWAGAHGVKVIDLYTYIQNNIEISPDGIHYNPKPTTGIWNYILSNL